MYKVPLITFTALALGISAQGQNLLSVNPSFDAQGTGTQATSGNPDNITGWHWLSGTPEAFQNNFVGMTNTDGINGLLVRAATAGIETVASARPSVTAGQTYQLNFKAGDAFNNGVNQTVSLLFYGQNTDYTNVLGTFSLNAVRAAGTGTTAYQEYSLVGVAPLGATYAAVQWSSPNTFNLFDGPVLTQAVPEPSAFLSVCGGAGMLLGMARRRRS